jgi:hypothetical protein
VKELGLARQRLLHAGDVPGILAAAWEAFELAGAVADATAERSADLYPAFTFARGAAVAGRNAIAFAPSMPPGMTGLIDSSPPFDGDVHDLADALAGLASAVAARLREAAGFAADPYDRAACTDAAHEADRMAGLLARRQ